MRVLLTGSRDWKKRGPVEMMMLGMKQLYPDVHFILGDCPRGLDAIALAICKDHDLSHFVHVADWQKFGRGAGPERNGRMVKDKPDVAFAYRVQEKSPGTDNCIGQAQRKGIPSYIMRDLPNLMKDGTVQVAGTKGYRYNSEVEGP
jgi:hypothetical protein